MNHIPQLMKLTPHIAKTIWGGDRLSKLKNISGDKVGETWELSNLREGASSFQGRRITDVVKNNPKEFWGESGDLSYLIKFIDTNDNLSVQVHPDDEFAKKHENSRGKSECWLILDAPTGDGIYLGSKAGVNRDKFQEAIAKKEDLSKFLNFYKVERGNFFFVPSGTLHAIGKNIFLLEIQQSSGITYRAWDWNRVDENGKPRELHINKALQVINFDKKHNSDKNFQFKKDVFKDEIGKVLLTHPEFKVELFKVLTTEEKTFSLKNDKRARAVIGLEGKIVIKRGEEEESLSPYQTILCPFSGEKELTISGQSDSVFVMVS